jgi:hypothetical protein
MVNCKYSQIAMDFGRPRFAADRPSLGEFRMASVALCPRCSHDLLVPHDTDPDAWAQCSECNVLFQVRDAITRELGELRLVEPLPEGPVEEETVAVSEDAKATDETPHDETLPPHPTPTVDISAQKTIDDLGGLDDQHDVAPIEVNVSDDEQSASSPTESPEQSPPTLDEIMKSTAPPASMEPQQEEQSDFVASKGAPEELPAVEPSTDTEADLASAQTVADVAEVPVSSDDRGGATNELSSESVEEDDTEFELEASTGEPPSDEPVPTWDDSEQMERLLAAADTPPADMPPADDDAPTPLPQIDAVAEHDDRPVYANPDEQAVVDTEMFSNLTGPRRPRRRSLVRTLTGIVVFGIVGIGLGALVLMWTLGPEGDVLNVAQYLPAAILPAEFSSPSATLAGASPRRVDPNTETASFDSSETTAKSDNQSILDDVTAMQAGNEPAQFTPSDATPLAADNAPQISGAPAYTADELAVSLKTAKVAQPGLVEGDLHDGKQVQHAKGYSYSMLCDLADKLTFAEAGSRPEYLEALQREADALFRTTLADAHTRGDVALIVPRWLSFANRPDGGVFFAGEISQQIGKGSVLECQVDLGAGEPLTILVPKSRAELLDHATGPVAVVGSIVDSPAQNVAGYEGDATQAVWVGQILPLE